MFPLLRNKTFLILSYWGYPFGGGEEYLYQTAIWAVKYGMKTRWICFAGADNKHYEEFSVDDNNGFKMIKIPGGFNEDILYNWIKIINPDIIHHQGHLRKHFYGVVSQLRIPFVSGIHFWNGIINLDPVTYNTQILHNIDKHRIDEDFIKLYNEPYCFFYSVSKFVTDCINRLSDIPIKYTIYSGSLKEKCYVENNNPIFNKYVTIINIHKLKGGELVLYLLEKLLDIPFILIRTEYNSEETDKKIEEIIFERNKNGNAPCLYFERVQDLKFVFAQTKIFLAPSMVDETFCRTVNETMMNNIPVITSGYGNLKYLVDGAGIIIDPFEQKKWASTIKELYYDNDILSNIIEKTKHKYIEYSEDICKNMFFDTISDILNLSKSNNIMILAPWCDQGLGIQARNYYNILKMANYNVHIFSYSPYGTKTTIDLQKNPSEWIVDNVYYSLNDREHVKDSEILQFIKKFNIGKCIIPETCWFRIFEIAELLRNNDVKCYAIPNIEIVRIDEITKHKFFHKILCNNELCRKIFNDYNVTNNEYVGYGIYDDKITFKQKKRDKYLKFLFIGGMNAFSRKHILSICEGFVNAYTKNNNIHLTCTIQKTNLLETDDIEKIKTYLTHPGITFIQSHLSYDDIINLYYTHHISIQVSKHEGLGLGFYEAIATGTPVISLNTPPHNEIINDNVNGWLIDCYYKEMTDNPNSFIKSAYFDPNVLTNKIIEIIDLNINEMAIKLFIDYNKRLYPNIFFQKFILALND